MISWSNISNSLKILVQTLFRAVHGHAFGLDETLTGLIVGRLGGPV